ncbi:cbb3-type cytochrome c oxidase subunit 3 [Curvibacter sp. APW13]|nr:cbb3-type cytochrome c oxidase subunit 3 [Curvibacter sp. APW13]MDT8992261.1 cbb3-type cytochrome c oxidase subunit 3 [Curvibacter sp. APW13]
MDINTLRSITTVVGLVVFVGIVWWAWSSKRSSEFSEAENLPFEQE